MSAAVPRSFLAHVSWPPAVRLAAMVLFVGIGVAVVRPSCAPPSHVARCGTPTAAARALVTPLEVGRELAGWRITCVGEAEGSVRVVVARRGAFATLAIHRVSEHAPPPPARSGALAVYYMHDTATDADAASLARALGYVLAAHAHATPRSLRPFGSAQNRR
jgi:hypothetical protein